MLFLYHFKYFAIPSGGPHLPTGLLTYRFFPQETSVLRFSLDPPPPLETTKMRAFLRLWSLSCAIPLPLDRETQSSLMSDPTLLYKQYKICEKQKNWPMNLRQKIFYISYQDVSKKSKNILTKISNFLHDVSQRNVTAAKPFTPKRKVDVSCGQNRYWDLAKLLSKCMEKIKNSSRLSQNLLVLNKKRV